MFRKVGGKRLGGTLAFRHLGWDYCRVSNVRGVGYQRLGVGVGC